LQVTAHPFGAEHAFVDGEVLPGLKADDLVVLDLQLVAALLAAEAAVGLDSRSGSTGESARWPVGYAFNGPNLASSSEVKGGSAAIGPFLERGVPQVPMREGEQLLPAGRTDVLVVARGVLRPVVAVAQFPLDNDLVIDVDLRRERLPAAVSDTGLFAEILVVLIVTALALADGRIRLDELDGSDPLDHLEAELVFDP
jgi:hypothetical protein